MNVQIAFYFESVYGSFGGVSSGWYIDDVRIEPITAQPALSVTPVSRDVPCIAGTTTFTVSNTGAGTMNWTAVENPDVDWLSITSGSSGTNSGTITITYTANNTSSARPATIRVTAAGATDSPVDVTVTQAETPPGFCVTRSVQAYYIPGVTMTVTLSSNPTPDISAFTVEDSPPAGWTVSNWSADGNWDAVNKKIKFGLFYDDTPRTFTYDVTPPAGTSGIQTFFGTGSQDGSNCPIGGVSQVDSGSYHPADNNSSDFTITIAEVTAYAAAWRRGDPWPIAPNPILPGFVSKAHYLWQHGESYVYNPSAGDAPDCWVSDAQASAMIAINAPLSPSTAVCDMPQGYTPGQAFTVTINITPLSGVSGYLVEDAIPAGWTISNISDAGSFDAVNNKVKFGPFSDDTARNLTYQITPPATASGTYNFAGVASFDGDDVAITGIREIQEDHYDLDDDGDVDIVDIMMVASRWNCSCGDECYDPENDLDSDCDIDIVDIMMVAAQWGWEE